MPLPRVMQPAIQYAYEGFPAPHALGLRVGPAPTGQTRPFRGSRQGRENGWDAICRLPEKPHDLRYGGWIVAGIIIERAVRATCNCELQRDPRETLVHTSTP